MRLVDALVAVVVLAAAGAALGALLLSATTGARNAALDGRRAELAQRAIDRVRSGLAVADSGSVTGLPGGEPYEAIHLRRDDLAPGALEVTVAPVAGGGALVFEGARPAP